VLKTQITRIQTTSQLPIKFSVKDCIGNTPLVYLNRLFPQRDIDVIAKLEYVNPGGSIKDRPARFIIEQGLQDGSIHPGKTHLVESTSGNFGIALSMVARVCDLKLTCVVDPKISKANLKILNQLGAFIEMVREPDDQGGYLKTRIRRVKELTGEIPHSFWINQYANQLNWQAHYCGTAQEITDQLDKPVHCLVAAVSTTGSILGCARRLRESFPDLKVIAVDALGSAIFGAQSAPRELPGIGSSRVPEILNQEEIDEIIYVNDKESSQGCRDILYQEGIFAGGSSGSVVAAIKKLLPNLPSHYRIVTIFPDRGERYLDMVYDQEWVDQLK